MNEGTLPVNSDDYLDLISSLEAQFCEEENELEEKVCCRQGKEVNIVLIHFIWIEILF